MENITVGEERFISEVGREWKRLVSDVLETMEDVPSIVKDRIEVLDKTYREEFND